MIDTVIIKSSRSAGELKFSEPKPPGLKYPVAYFRVSLKDREIAIASVKVFIYEPYDLAAFFEDLAAHWRGWEGAKEWVSVERDFMLSCRMDELGSVAIEVTLKSGLDAEGWCVRAVIHVQAGQLEEIAGKVKDFLHVNRVR